MQQVVVSFESKNKSEHIEWPSTVDPCSNAAYSKSILTRCTETELKENGKYQNKCLDQQMIIWTPTYEKDW